MMSQEKLITDIAQRVLAAPAHDAKSNSWLLDRSKRLLRIVRIICDLPELTQPDLPVDRLCLDAAVYFCHAALAESDDRKNLKTAKPSLEPNRLDSTKISARIAAEKLHGHLSEQKINKISRIILESGNKLTNLNEAKILSDAQNLDDMGIVGLFSLFRNSSPREKGPSDVLRSWKKKIDYGYFQARLKESFHFESVKRIAKKRFELTENFMSGLQDECSAKDILDAVENMFSKT
jgi:hypothetical protein